MCISRARLPMTGSSVRRYRGAILRRPENAVSLTPMKSAKVPYGLRIIENCIDCEARPNALFCNLGPAATADLNAIRQVSVYPAGAVLFVEGQPGQGLYILCSGRAKLTASSRRGRSVIIRVANAGEVLGFSATVSGATYVGTAETLEPTQVNYLPRAQFLEFLGRHSDVAVRTAQHLSLELSRAYEQIARVALSPTVRSRLAGLLLESAGERKTVERGTRFQMRLTHEEVAEIISTSRETVSRLLGEFRREGLIEIRGAHVIIVDPAALGALIH
jgi:CRP/FNR family transcriptional regulator, cyclic AMP receptor protein